MPKATKKTRGVVEEPETPTLDLDLGSDIMEDITDVQQPEIHGGGDRSGRQEVFEITEPMLHVRRPAATSRTAGASSPGTTSMGTSTATWRSASSRGTTSAGASTGTWRSASSRSATSAGASVRSSKTTRMPCRQIWRQAVCGCHVIVNQQCFKISILFVCN